MARSSRGAARIARCALAAVLAVSLIPTTGLALSGAATEQAEQAEQAVETTAVIEGQALVLYHVDEGATTLSEDGSSDAAPLEESGFAVAQTWDFSAVDEMSDEEASLLAEEGVATDETDLRVALVVREGASADELVEELESLDFVEAAQPNHVFSVSSAPNDTYYTDWQYNMTSETAGVDLEAALEARSTASTEENIVAVIDTGVDYTNPELVDSMWSNPGIPGLPGDVGDHGYDFFSNDGDPRPGSSIISSHGTHCAGMIAATTNNGEGVAGSSSDTKIMALKVSEDESTGGIYENSVVSSYQYVIAAALAGENVVAISNSWDIGGDSPVLDYLVNQAGKAGILSIFAAGNNASDTDTLADGATIGLASPYAVVVASTNEGNYYSTFTNYNATAIDIAAPGSNILSTVSTTAARTFFMPALTRQAQGESVFTYYNTFEDYKDNPDKYAISLLDSSGNEVTASSDALSVTYTEDAGYGAPGLLVSLDTSEISDTSTYYTVMISWKDDNVFKDSTYEASDYALGMSFSIDQSNFPVSGEVTYQCMLASPSTGTLETSAVGHTTYDNFVVMSAAINEIDTASEKLAYGLLLTLIPNGNSLTNPSDEGVIIEAAVSDYAIGLVADGESVFEPYALMSGTSMATPMLAGVVAQLCTLNPDVSALEIRGMTIGSTEPVETELGGVEKHTATDGRFSWEAALDDEPASANTWSASGDAESGEVTVYGYGLSDATVTLDGKEVEILSRDDGSITFAAPDTAFDGGQHRIDVTDESTGKTHCASYALPLADSQHELVSVGELPEEIAGNAASKLVASDSALYLASYSGDYLYRTTDPRGEGWTQVSSPGNPWDSDSDSMVRRGGIVYTAVGDDLYAFALDEATNASGELVLEVYVASYNAAGNVWSGFSKIGELEYSDDTTTDIFTMSQSATEHDGSAYFLFTIQYQYQTEDSQTGTTYVTYLYRSDTGEVASVTLEESFCLSSFILSYDGALTMIGIDGETNEIKGYSYDSSEGKWDDLGAFSNAPELTKSELIDFLTIPKVQFGSGVIAVGQASAGLGDASLLNLETMAWESLGSFGLETADGVAVASLAVYNDHVYLNTAPSDSTSDGAAGELYLLPYITVEQVLGISCPTENVPDIDHEAWYHEYVDWAYSAGIMTGYDEGAGEFAGYFGPNNLLTRAEAAQIFYNEAGNPAAGDAPFSDCDQAAWYNAAIAWVAAERLFTGYEDGSDRFGPGDELTREQMAVVLWRQAGCPQGAGDLSRFPDGDAVSDWAREAVVWAVGEGILSGYDDTGLLDPTGSITRAQTATVLMRINALN